MVRAGHTEGSVDLCHLAGLKEAAVICEVVNADGSMARLPDLAQFCQQHQLKMCSIEQLIKYRRQRERLVRRELSLKLPTPLGVFDLIVYSSIVDPEPHLAMTIGGVGVEHEQLVNRCYSTTLLAGKGHLPAADRTIDRNKSAFKLAPPTRAPSTSGWAINAGTFSGLTLPPY